MSEPLHLKAAALLETCRRAGLKIATAESCTGGLISATLTDVAGSSDVFDRGFVTYSNAAKEAMLAVSPFLIEVHGAVSEAVALAMAEGALVYSNADITVSVTGVAGPGGGSAEKPIGLVHFGAARRDGRRRTLACRFGDIGRSAVRTAAVRQAFELLREFAV
jgi:nicotinamide-nucleotide amidase